MVYPRISGDRLVWQDRFTNVGMVLTNGGILVGAPTIYRGLSGGQVRYYGAAHDLRWAGDFTVVSRVVVAVSGSDQALLSLGTAASRRCEVGITGTGQPYAWGTAQVALGAAIPDGYHDIEFAVTLSGLVTCTVDGVVWGSGSIAFGTAVDRLLVAGSCLGGLTWLGQTLDIRVIGLGSHFALADLPGLISLLDPAYGVTYAVPPIVQAITPKAGSSLVDFTQPVASLRPSITSVSGEPALSHALDMISEVTVPATWDPLHNGSASYSATVVVPRNTLASTAIFGTRSGPGTDGAGMYLYGLVGGQLRISYGNGLAGGTILDQSSVASVLSTGIPALVVHRYAGSGNVEVYVANTIVINSAFTGPPLATSCGGIAIGATRASGGNTGTQDYLMTLWGAGVLTDGILSQLGAYCRTRWGVAW